MSTEIKRLYRSRDERMIGGVCGGLEEYLNVDVSLIRILFVFLALMGGPGILIYLIMLIVIPEEPLVKDDVLDVEPETNKEEK